MPAPRPLPRNAKKHIDTSIAQTNDIEAAIKEALKSLADNDPRSAKVDLHYALYEIVLIRERLGKIAMEPEE